MLEGAASDMLGLSSENHGRVIWFMSVYNCDELDVRFNQTGCWTFSNSAGVKANVAIIAIICRKADKVNIRRCSANKLVHPSRIG